MSRVNQRELSEILAVSQVTLTEWQKAEPALPMAVREKNGLENLYETREVIDWLIQRELARAKVETPRDRLDKLRAMREELALRSDVGQLVDMAELEPMLERWVERVSNAIDGLAEKGAIVLQQVTDAEGQHQILRAMAKEIRDALGSFDFAADAAADPRGDPGLDAGAPSPHG